MKIKYSRNLNLVICINYRMIQLIIRINLSIIRQILFLLLFKKIKIITDIKILHLKIVAFKKNFLLISLTNKVKINNN
jgi:hypothetical protein